MKVVCNGTNFNNASFPQEPHDTKMRKKAQHIFWRNQHAGTGVLLVDNLVFEAIRNRKS